MEPTTDQHDEPEVVATDDGATSERGPSGRPQVWDAEVPARERRIAFVLLALVLVAIVIVHLRAGLNRPINWDESVYLTQVLVDRPAVFMEPHRTRGMVLLVAPIALFDPGMVALRSYLLLLVVAGTAAAFWPWIRTIGWAASLAAALFSLHWVTVFYAVEVLPSFPTALLSVAATGVVAQALMGERVARWHGPVLGGLFLLHALVRPPDAVVIGLGVAIVVLVFSRDRAVTLLAPAAAGGVVGLGAWLVEGWVRFGFSPVAMATSASEYSVDGDQFLQLPLYVRSLDRTLRCAGSCIDDYLAEGAPWQLPSMRTTAFLVAVAIAIAVGLLVGRRQRLPLLAALVPAAGIVLLYGTVGSVMNLRYMMPAFATGVLAAAIGVRVAWKRLPRRPFYDVGRIGLVLVVLATLAWQAGYGTDRLSSTNQTRYRAHDLGLAVQEHLDDGPCAVGAAVNYPQLQYWTGCATAPVVRGRDGELQDPLGELGSYVDLSAAAESGAQVFAVIRADPPAASPVAAWERLPSPLAEDRGFEVRRWSPGDPLPAPPCPGPGGPDRRLADVISESC